MINTKNLGIFGLQSVPVSIDSFSVSLHFMSNLLIGLVYVIALPARKIQGPKEDHVLQTERSADSGPRELLIATS